MSLPLSFVWPSELDTFYAPKPDTAVHRYKIKSLFAQGFIKQNDILTVPLGTITRANGETKKLVATGYIRIEVTEKYTRGANPGRIGRILGDAAPVLSKYGNEIEILLNRPISICEQLKAFADQEDTEKLESLKQDSNSWDFIKVSSVPGYGRGYSLQSLRVQMVQEKCQGSSEH